MIIVTSTMCRCGDNQQCAEIGADNMFVPHTDRRTGEPCPGIPQPKVPGGAGSAAVRRFLDDITPDHTYCSSDEDAYVWEWSTPDGMWKIEYHPNFLGALFNAGGATVTVSGPTMVVTVAADDIGLGILGANLRILGVIDTPPEEGDPDG